MVALHFLKALIRRLGLDKQLLPFDDESGPFFAQYVDARTRLGRNNFIPPFRERPVALDVQVVEFPNDALFCQSDHF
ncbi:hypothetical protein D3C85_1411800 [compost metagenome]